MKQNLLESFDINPLTTTEALLDLHKIKEMMKPGIIISKRRKEVH